MQEEEQQESHQLAYEAVAQNGSHQRTLTLANLRTLHELHLLQLVIIRTVRA